MSAFSGEKAVVQNEDQVRLTDAGCTLGHQEGGYVAAEREALSEGRASVAKSRALALSSRIRNSGFFHEGTGDGETLSLTAGEVPAVLLQMETSWPSFFSTISLAWAIVSASQMSLSVASSAAPFHVGTDTSLEKSCFLGNYADFTAERTAGIIFDIHAVHEDFSFAGIVETGD